MADLINKWDVVSKLIDLENEFQHFKPFHGFEHAMYRKICELEIAIGKTPPADAVEVVHGRWERCGGDLHSSGYAVYCSVCHKNHFVHYKYSLGGLYGCKELFEKPKYCPSCGAVMENE